MNPVNYIEVSHTELQAIQKKLSLLIVTATKIETENLHNQLAPYCACNGIIQTYHENQTYYIGIFGAYAVVHVQCSNMGAISIGGSLNTVRDAIDCWKPKAVVMIGIAFGVNRKKQNIGDVLVSESIIPVGIKRVGERDIYRGPVPQGGTILLNRFKNIRGWSCELPEEKKAKYSVAPLLSGESLIDNIAYRNELLNNFPEAKGGEMEGFGLYSAANSKKLEWVVVKGICDFADGKKHVNKSKNQNVASRTAVSLCLNVFSSKIAFKALDIIPITKQDQALLTVEEQRHYEQKGNKAVLRDQGTDTVNISQTVTTNINCPINQASPLQTSKAVNTEKSISASTSLSPPAEFHEELQDVTDPYSIYFSPSFQAEHNELTEYSNLLQQQGIVIITCFDREIAITLGDQLINTLQVPPDQKRIVRLKPSLHNNSNCLENILSFHSRDPIPKAILIDVHINVRDVLEDYLFDSDFKNTLINSKCSLICIVDQEKLNDLIKKNSFRQPVLPIWQVDFLKFLVSDYSQPELLYTILKQQRERGKWGNTKLEFYNNIMSCHAEGMLLQRIIEIDPSRTALEK